MPTHANSSESGLTLRPMLEDDLRGVMRIEIEQFSSPWTPLAFALDLRHNGNARYQVLLFQGEVVGYNGMWFSSKEAYVMKIAVDPACQKKGWGSLLLGDMLEYARELKLRSIALEVRVSNREALSLYERKGFVVQERIPQYYSKPAEDAYVMALSL